MTHLVGSFAMPIKDPFKTLPAPSTTSLDPDRIVYTIGKLNRRIEERFPGSGLSNSCRSLREIGERTKKRLDEVARPILWLRSATWLMAAVVILAVLAALRAVFLALPEGFDDAFVAPWGTRSLPRSGRSRSTSSAATSTTAPSCCR